MLRFLLILLFILFPTGVLLRLELFQNVFISPLDIVVCMIALVIMVRELWQKKEKSRKLKFFILFLGIGFISLVLNSWLLTPIHIATALLYMVRYACYMSLIFIGHYLTPVFKKKLEYVLLASGMSIVLFGFIQYFFYQTLRNLYYLGWDDHLYRMFSTFLDPNFAGAFFVLYLIFLLNLLLKQKKRWSLYFVSLIFFSVLTSAAILLTHSRSAIIMLVATLLTYFVYSRRVKMLLVSVVVTILLFFLSSNRSIESMNPFRMASTEARITSAQDAISVISHSPLYGVGFNAYRYAQLRYGLRNELGAQISHADAATDDSFLFVFATTGIIGLLVYGFFYREIFKEIMNRKNLYRFLLIAMLIGVFVDSLFINTLFYTPILIWVNILIGIYGFSLTKDYK